MFVCEVCLQFNTGLNCPNFMFVRVVCLQFNTGLKNQINKYIVATMSYNVI